MDIRDSVDVKNNVKLRSILVAVSIYLFLAVATAGIALIALLIAAIISNIIYKKEIQNASSNSNVFKKIKEVIESDLYIRRRDAIAEARRLVLDEYQLFPFIVNRIGEKKSPLNMRKFLPYSQSLRSRIIRRLKNLYAY